MRLLAIFASVWLDGQGQIVQRTLTTVRLNLVLMEPNAWYVYTGTVNS